MGKYLLLWSLDGSRVPTDPKERGAGWGLLMDMVKQDLEKGISKDWGSFPGEGRGYAVVEGSHVDIMHMTQQYAPYVLFETHPVSTVSEVDELIKSLSE